MLKNSQQQEPQTKNFGERVEIVDIFHTLQGEGPFTGRAAIFIRLAGCNLQCPWCDTDYTSGRHWHTVQEITKAIVEMLDYHRGTHLIVITGGEPLRQDIVPLIKVLYATTGAHVQIESNGVYGPPVDLIDMIREHAVTYVVSPKTSVIHKEAKLWASNFKYVISANSIHPDDGLPMQALGHKASPYIARPNTMFPRTKIYVNPEDHQDPVINQKNLEACRNSALDFGYTMGVQLHKLVNLP